MTRRGFLASLLLAPFAALLKIKGAPAPKVVNTRRSFMVTSKAARLLGYTGPKRVDWEDGQVVREVW